MDAPLLKEIILLTVKAEAGQMIKDITSGVGAKNALSSGAKRAGKSILKRGTQRLMKGLQIDFCKPICNQCYTEHLNVFLTRVYSHERQRSYT